jgi:hypothetical protein
MPSEFRAPSDAYSSIPSSAVSDVSDIAAPLVAWKGWIKFIAIVQILFSVLYVAVLVVIALRGVGAFGVGIVIALLPIYLSVLMLQTVAAAERSHEKGDAFALTLALGKVRIYFLVQAIVTASGLIFAILFTILAAKFATALYGLHHLPH